MSIIKISLNYCARCKCRICESLLDYKKELKFIQKFNSFDTYSEIDSETVLIDNTNKIDFCKCEKPMSTLIFSSCLDYCDLLKKYIIESGLEYKVNHMSIKPSSKGFLRKSFVKYHNSIIEKHEDCELDYIKLCNKYDLKEKSIAYIFIEEDKLSNLKNYENRPSLIYAEAFMLIDISSFSALFTKFSGYEYNSVYDGLVFVEKEYNDLKIGFENSIKELTIC